MKFPALYNDADAAAARAQAEHLLCAKAEYGLLVAAAILAMHQFVEAPYLIAYAIVFVASLVVMLARVFRSSVQDWYRCRALAESIKTSAWRYAMRAEPFDDERTQDARGDFRKSLQAIFKANQHIGPRIAGFSPDGQQITSEMDGLRNKSLEERKQTYLKDRIRNQRGWYAQQAKKNKANLKFWVIACVIVYLAAALFVFSRIRYPNATLPTEPLIVIAASIIGWIQIKRFSELSSAYSLTAHEIGIIEDRASQARTNKDFSDFVNEAEQAFSREHTQWTARQQHI